MLRTVTRGVFLGFGLWLAAGPSQGQKAGVEKDAFLEKKSLAAWLKDLDRETSEARRRSIWSGSSKAFAGVSRLALCTCNRYSEDLLALALESFAGDLPARLIAGDQ